MLKLNEQERKKDVDSNAEEEEIAIAVAGVNLQQGWMKSSTAVRADENSYFFAHTPIHEMITSVFSKRRNEIGERMTVTRKMQKQ